MGKKCLLHHFLADKKIGSVDKKNILASYSMNSKFLLAARCTLTMSLQQCLLSWHGDLCEFITTAFHCKNSMQVRSKNSQGGRKQCLVTVKGVNNPTWTTQ